MRNKKQTGFTLIELLVVIAIIGLLASVVLLSLNSARAKSRDAKRLADVRQLVSALELAFNDLGGYPAGTSGVPNSLTPTYIGQIPTAPTPYDNNSGSTCTATNNNYTYSSSGTAYTATNGSGTQVYPDYNYVFCLGGLTGGYSAGLHTATKAGIQ